VKYRKLVARILGGAADAHIHFDELCALLKNLGFELRVKGSHHIEGLPACSRPG